MHLVLLTRGIDRQVQEWRSLMNAQRFAWKRKNLATGEEEMQVVQGALRPIQFWEYVFPEECLNDVLGALDIKGPTKRPEIKGAVWLLRKMLKLDQIPTTNNFQVTGYLPAGTLNGKQMPVIPVHLIATEGVAVYPIGIKKDPIKEYDWGIQGKYFQEGL